MKDKRYFTTGTIEVSIHRGYDINDKTKLIEQTCKKCGNKTGFAYFSKTGKPTKEGLCIPCIDREAEDTHKSHVEMLT